MSGLGGLLRPLVGGLRSGAMPHQEASIFEVGQVPPGLPVRDSLAEVFDVLRNTNLAAGLQGGEQFLLPVVCSMSAQMAHSASDE